MCANGLYGIGCLENCTCQNGAKCSHVDGSCKCASGWKGSDCSERVCDEKSYGEKCEKCKCQFENTETYVLPYDYYYY